MGSKDVYLKKRAEGTERADKAAPARGVKKFFGALPEWEIYAEPSVVDLPAGATLFVTTRPA